MEERRKIERKNLAFFTRIYNREDGQLLGHLGDMTVDGVMVISRAPLHSERVYRLHMELLDPISERSYLDFEARCLWSRLDQLSGEYYNAGFQFTRIDPKDLEVVDQITQRYRLHD